LGRLIVTLATLLALILGAAFVMPAFTDWNAYRQDIEQAASAILGRNIAIAGAIDIALLPEPHLRAAKIAAEGGTADGAQMTAEAVDLTLSLQALLAGRIEASRLKLVRPFLIVDFSKPLQNEPPPALASALPIAGSVSSLEIEGGRVSILQDASRPDALTLANVDGTLFAPSPGNAYRFNGRFSQDGRRYEAKFVAAAAPKTGVKLTGSVIGLASRVTFQADGVLHAGTAPVFVGAVAMAAPPASGLAGAAFDVQAKASARIDLSGASLSDLVLTIEAENRPQVLMGAATLAFPERSADIALQARSLDADALLAGATGGAGRAPNAAAGLLWLYPDFGLRLSLSADQLQLRGELIEGVKLQGTRGGQTWTFQEAAATLPGDSLAKASGSLVSVGGKSSLAAELALQGKNLGRLNRWIVPPAAGARIGPARSFAVKGALTLSDELAAFTDISGDVDGTPFTASLRLGRAPVRNLEVSLAGESFDLRGLETGGGGGALSAESLKAVWQAGLQQAAPLVGDAQSFDTADIDVSAGAIRTNAVEARNVAVRLKFNQDLLTVTKLSLETPEGLFLTANGVVPLRGGGQGRLDGRLDARSGQAVLKAAALLGASAESLQGRRFEELAPASIVVDYGAEEAAGTATARLNGTLGVARVQGRAQLKGALAEWRSGQLSAGLDLSDPDGNRLVALLVPGIAPAPGSSATPGQVTIRAEGASSRYAVTGSLTSAPLQAQIDGTSELKGQALAFSGRAQAASPAPEQFLPPALLALLGGEPKTDLRIETDLALGSGEFAATKLKAETPKNLVGGRLSVSVSDRAKRIDADLKAGQLSLPSLFGYLLTQPADRAALPMPASVSAPSSELWSGQPFALGLFQDVTANIALTARTLKLGETFALSDAQVAAKLENARLDVQRLDGKALSGDLSATLSLDASSGTAVAAAVRVSLSGADLSALWAPGSPAIATGKTSLSLRAAGQGLSPRGVISVLRGEGDVHLSEGRLLKFAPAGVQKAAEELMAGQAPLTEEAVKKKTLESAQSSDFKFGRFDMPVAIRDGMLEAPSASFLGEDGAVKLEAYLDLSSLQADTTWQLGAGSDRRSKWPPVKLQISAPLRALGAAPRTLLAEDFTRAVLIHKMEGDISRLESLNKAQALPPPQTWAPAQQHQQQPKPARRKRAPENAPPPQQAGPLTGPTDFEKRMRDALRPGSPPPQPGGQ
jgi:uncharacterized protein involved in outer membrane biogenesis